MNTSRIEAPTYPALWACNGCGRALTLSPGEETCCGRGVTKIDEDIDCNACHDTGYRRGFRCPDCMVGTL